MAPVITEEMRELGLSLVRKALKAPPPEADFNTQYRRLAKHVESIQTEQQKQRLSMEEIYEVIRSSICQPSVAKQGSVMPLRWDDKNVKIQENELRLPLETGKNQKHQTADAPEKENSKMEAPAPKGFNTKTLPGGPKNPEPVLPEQAKENQNQGWRASGGFVTKNVGEVDTDANEFQQCLSAEQACWQMPMQMPTQMPVMQMNCLYIPGPQPCTYQGMAPSFPSAMATSPMGCPLVTTFPCPFGTSTSSTGFPQGLQWQQPGQLSEVATPSVFGGFTFPPVVREENPYAWLLEEEEMPRHRNELDMEEKLLVDQVTCMESVGIKLRNTMWDEDVAKPKLNRSKSC